MDHKYIIFYDNTITKHKTLKDVSNYINKDNTIVSRKFKHKHFITIDNYTIYKLNWNNPPPPTIVKFN